MYECHLSLNLIPGCIIVKKVSQIFLTIVYKKTAMLKDVKNHKLFRIVNGKGSVLDHRLVMKNMATWKNTGHTGLQ